MSNVAFSMRIDEDIKTRLQKIAQQYDRSTSYVANEAIKRYIENCELEQQAIDEALKEAEKGEFVSQQAVHKWLDSWGTPNELPMPKPDVFRKK